MSHRLTMLAAAGLLASALSFPAQAQPLPEPGVIPGDAPVTVEDARDIAFDHGMSRIDSIELDANSGRWDVEGVDAADRDIDVEIDANTGEVIRVER